MRYTIRTLSTLVILLRSIGAHAANKVVVIPLGGDSVSSTDSISACSWFYNFSGDNEETLLCPVNSFAVTGSCSSIGSQLVRSAPTGLGGSTGNPEPAEDATGWRCTTSSGALDIRVLCCPSPPSVVGS